MTEYKMLIGGQLVVGAGSMDVINPATARPFVRAPTASAAQLELAVVAAQEAFPSWSTTPWKDRRAMLISLADKINAEAKHLAHLLTREQGKPLPQAHFEVMATGAAIRYLASVKLDSERRPHAQGEYEIFRKPLGVVACITPWNFPMVLASNKFAAALIAGNTVILKPAPTTPLTTLEIGRIAKDIFPPGVFNVITDRNNLGPLMTTHPSIAKVSFTGSTDTGKLVMKSAAESVKRVTLELGGNDPAIVLEDADVGQAAQALAATAFLNAGQICVAPKRIYVADKVYDQFCSGFAEIAASLTIGAGDEDGTELGPLQNEAQFEKVKSYIADAKVTGKILTGGHACDRPGYFIEPTVVSDIENNTALVQEEQFGPVVPIVRFSRTDEAIAFANASNYGLGASVWSRDIERAKAIGNKLESGTVWINQHLAMGPDLPVAGAKQSGFGVEVGVEGVLEYTQIQVLNVA